MKTRLKDGSGERHYAYTHVDVDRHGNARVYFWRGKGHKKTRLHAIPGTPEFEAEYRVCFEGVPLPLAQPPDGPSTRGTVKWLCELYYASPAFLGLESTTRAVRRRLLESICRRAGTFSIAGMQPHHVAKLRDEKAATPDAANSLVKTLRGLFGWACLPEYRHATNNPAKDVKFLKSANPDGHRTWSEEDAQAYEVRHPIGTKARLAFDLFLYTGARISDVARFGPPMEQDGKLVFTEWKGRKRTPKVHKMPILPELRESIDATPTGLKTYLVTEFGVPYTVKGFGNWFKRQCVMAGLHDDLSAHGIRKMSVVRCVLAGATEEQLKALYGWTNSKQIATYARTANRAQLEAVAVKLLLSTK